MENLSLTFLFAFFIILGCLTLLGIGRLLTGKCQLKGSCGGKRPDKECQGQTSCELCQHKEEKDA